MRQISRAVLVRTAWLVTAVVLVVVAGTVGETWYRHDQHQDRLDAQCRRLIATSLGYDSIKGVHGATTSDPVPDGLTPPHGSRVGSVCRSSTTDLIINHYAVFDVPAAHAAADASKLSDVAGFVCRSAGLPAKRGNTTTYSTLAQFSMYCSTTIQYQGLKTLIFADFYRLADGNYRFVEWWTVGSHGRLEGRDDE